MNKTHTFEELSLVESNGFLAVHVSGEADIEHTLDGVEVLEIRLDACRKEGGRWVTGQVTLEVAEHQWLWWAIAERLEKTIETEVVGRSDRAEHCTLHRELTGV